MVQRNTVATTLTVKDLKYFGKRRFHCEPIAQGEVVALKHHAALELCLLRPPISIVLAQKSNHSPHTADVPRM